MASTKAKASSSGVGTVKMRRFVASRRNDARPCSAPRSRRGSSRPGRTTGVRTGANCDRCGGRWKHVDIRARPCPRRRRGSRDPPLLARGQPAAQRGFDDRAERGVTMTTGPGLHRLGILLAGSTGRSGSSRRSSTRRSTEAPSSPSSPLSGSWMSSSNPVPDTEHGPLWPMRAGHVTAPHTKLASPASSPRSRRPTASAGRRTHTGSSACYGRRLREVGKRRSPGRVEQDGAPLWHTGPRMSTGSRRLRRPGGSPDREAQP